MNKKLYKWHRILGLIALVPVIFWTLSGLTHPLMSNWFRPSIAKEVFHAPPLSQMKTKLSLQQVMDQNSIQYLRNFALVRYDAETFYQIMEKDSIIRYYSASDGKQLQDGDRKYAVYLARFFTQDQTSPIKDITLQRKFEGSYKPINRLLPVWKVSFVRPDGMDVYVETGQNRMGTFNNNTRKAFLWIFDQFHNWSFLATIGGESFRIIVLLVITGIMLLSLISGLTIYGLLWKKFSQLKKNRPQQGKEKRILHRYHRQIGLAVSLVMFAFVCSGAFHLAAKYSNNGNLAVANYEQIIERSALEFPESHLPVEDTTITKITLQQFDSKVYYDVHLNNKDTRYFDAKTGEELLGGDKQYAQFLAAYYRKGSINEGAAPVLTTISKFDHEYGFINKRLPVVKAAYADGQNWYIETATSKLATKVTNLDRAEGYTFIFLHKYFLMNWAGKDIRDIVSMLSAAGILVVSLFGMASFLKNR